MKRGLMVAVVTALIFSIASVSFAAANAFSDVPASHWAYNGVDNLAKNGIISYGDGNFFGNRNATRYEVAVMVANLYCKKKNMPFVTYSNPFSDVPSNHWANRAVTTLAAEGLEEGDGDGTFRGSRNITRYEFATLIAKLLVSTDTNINYSKTNPFSDVPKGHKNYDGVMIAAGTGIVSGYEDGTFRGDKTLNRYEIAITLNKVYKILFD
ncbi:MAG: S-layer homology domain-containing protein [Selenomonadaceae bacterium]|nr:S-layer homology domain-containing protein [Selenomonadaceae bacterium]